MTNSTIGHEVAQVNARAKVLGKAVYAGDMFLPGMLHAKILRSPYPHARIKAIDVSAASRLHGVRAVLTGEDAPRTRWGILHKERTILAQGCVRFAGEEVAAVVAEDEETARDALDLIQVSYEELPPLLDPQQALAEDAPIVHPGRTNIAHEIQFERGDVDAGFHRAALVHEQTYTTHAQYPGYMEPNACVAAMDAEGRLTVWAPTHSIFLMRGRLAAALELPASRVRVVQTMTGGAFGQKMLEDDTCLVAALLALKTGAPVRLVNSRLEDFLACPTSVPERITMKMGMRADGMIIAKEVRILADCGAYCGLSNQILHVSAMRSDNMHANGNVRVDAKAVYTHTPPHGAFRGFGGTQAQFALNSHIDEMAAMLGLDPVEVHKKNAIPPGSTSLHGWEILTNGTPQCLDQCADAIGWRDKRQNGKQDGPFKRGVGIAAAIHVSGNRTMGNWDGSTINLRLNEDGRVQVFSGECDMGQGATTVIAQIVAHELDLPLSHVQVVQPDTDSSAYAIGAIGSRVTIVAGNAAIRAGRALREKVLGQAARVLGVAQDQLELRDSLVFSRTDPDINIDLATLSRASIWREDGEVLQASATWDPKTVMHDDLYGNVAPAYSFAAQAVEVEVDTETGRVRILDSFISDDCGKALNPLTVHGQTNGAAVQAMGWALYEEVKLEHGRISNVDFADYTMPSIDAIPMLRNGLVETLDPNGPYGAKGASETAIQPGAGAIANAVFHATGVRIRDLPITPEKILSALAAMKEESHA